MVKIIGNVLAIRWTAGAVEHLRPSFSALLDAEERLAAVFWGRAGQPRQLKQISHAVLDTLGWYRESRRPPSRISGGGPHVGPLRPGTQGLAAMRPSGTTALPAKPAEFFHFLATWAEADTGGAQTKICTASQLAGSQPRRGMPPSRRSGEASAE